MNFLKKILFIGLLLSTCSFVTGDSYRILPNNAFKAGEYFEYKVKYGFLSIGEATVDVSPQIFLVNNRPCYRVNIFGRTTGLTDLFHIRNTYRSYLDTAAILPQKFLMDLQENNYRKEQTIIFDHVSNVAVREGNKEKKNFKLPDNIHDVVSGYYFLRTIDFSKVKAGDSVSSNMFFDDEIYNMKVRYNGRSVIRTRYGKIKVIKLNPVLPKNKMFEGEDAIRIWVSDDKNRVPIRIEVDFAVGSATMELKEYRNVKYAFDWN
ncbi:hypothetical protein EMA8858_00711 [Emticicia aquatica]|jgi:hypothetical protein|uniref:DUF3108 domain-containing protein n=1 Tax=Emticicia aquatica TaxID=1681835 RepID=A0ABN8ERY8_9BACT|nr:DUF3108 domain-containing protein [Emticicia aquatica]CAH0994601.1 hypothetical protein EMA8858_00711 [Emticicia aquatica]